MNDEGEQSMLYGDLTLQNDILKAAEQYAEKNNFKIVYGAMVGSISKGLEYADSDYDTRFLYVRKDFPEKICIPWELEEKELVKRFYPEKNLVYEWIPFWELSSFLQFLVKPSFKEDFSVGLYNIVGWTFQSPYQWDPYSIRNKIMPLIDDIFIREYEISYHLKEIERWYQKDTMEIVAKNYMYALHAAMTIDWCIKKNTQPPIFFKALLNCCTSQQLYREADAFVKKAQQESVKIYRKSVQEKHGTHFTIMTSHKEVIDTYIEKIYEKGKILVKDFTPTHNMIQRCENRVTQMYEIINEAIKNEAFFKI